MILIVLVVGLIVLLYLHLKKPLSYWRDRGVEGPEPVLLFGNLIDNVLQTKSLAEVINEMYTKFKSHRYFGAFQFRKPILFVNDLELIKLVTIKDFDFFTDHMNKARPDVDLIWSKSVVSMTGEAWRDMRATLSPSFTSSKMRLMFGLINEVAEGFVAHFLAKNEKICTMEMKDTFTRVTNDVIATCAFGIKVDSLKERENEFYLKGKKAFDFTGFKQLVFFLYNSAPTLMKLLGIKMFSNDVVKYFSGVINETIKEREQKGIARPDMIHLLLEAQKGRFAETASTNDEDSFASTTEYSLQQNGTRKRIQISDTDIIAQAFTFFFGGFDTTSYLMCFLAYELALNPEIQEKLREEIEETLRKNDGKISYEAIMKMNYLDMVVSETLRKWPPAPMIDRMCTKEYTIKGKEGELVLTPGSTVWIPIFGLHRDPEIYPNPEKFDPERFSPDNRVNINSSAFIPFGSGPRNCIASRFAILENKTVIFNILKHFEIVPVDKTAIPLVLSRKNLTLTSEGGFWLGLKRRNN